MADTRVSALPPLSVPAFDDLLYVVDDPAGTPLSAHVTAERLAGLFLPSVCQGRLTTESGVPISTSDRTAQSTLYFTPYLGNRVALYDGTRWKLYAFPERSLVLSGLTVARPFDVFLYDNAGTLTLELTAWTNDTTRATALTTQDGVYVKTGATTRRYLGTIYTTSATTTEDSATKRFVWNVQNQAARTVVVRDATVSWTYALVPWRQARGSTDNQIAIVVGISGLTLELTLLANVAVSTIIAPKMGISQDVIAAPLNYLYLYLQGGSTVSQTVQSVFTVTAGYHYFAWVEGADNANTHTFFGGALSQLSGVTYA